MIQSDNTINFLSPQQAYTISVYTDYGYAGYVQLKIILKEVYSESKLHERLQALSADYEQLRSRIIFVSEGEARQTISKKVSTIYSVSQLTEDDKLCDT